MYNVQQINLVCSTEFPELQFVCSYEMTDARTVKHKKGQSKFEMGR